ncbi:hypothetical protein MKQ68_14640 [Chitinophaga horti]|uniref:Uncharacterized protein n=1 Tax=Chitinophaga horti TaxID=2920382 RepID=A0ABY6IVD4_9BACT|nr:hypothetical protein [Chitinophaga horti]UYQ91328.1 hypothetical protein MKQ68_14640 [Chitinophaga horti]
MSANKHNNEPATVKLRGRLILKTFARNSKSEHLGVHIDTGEHTYLIRNAGGNPFMDNPFEALAGKFIEAEGRISDYVFFAKTWVEIDAPES